MNDGLSKKEITSLALEVLIKAGLVFLVFYYAMMILKPFFIPVLWGIILAVTFSPLIERAREGLRIGRTVLITAFTVLTVGGLLVPAYFFSDSVINGSQELARSLKEGTFQVPPPPEDVRTWPLVGPKVYDYWNGAWTPPCSSSCSARSGA